MSTILAFDFGLNHIGVASGNTTTKTCSPQKSINAKDGIPDAQSLDRLVRDWLPAVFVVGLPLNMDGTEQEMTFKARKFGNRLKEKYKKEVVFIDERLSSASAKEEIFERGGFKALAKDKGAIDSLSAVTILEQYFTEHA